MLALLVILTLTQSPQDIIAPQIVPEGPFAIQLAATMGLGVTDNSAVAEETLANVGIQPDTGWLDQYPMTPKVVEELRDRVDRAYCYGPSDGPDATCNAMLAAFYRAVDVSGLGINYCSDDCGSYPSALWPSEEEVIYYYTYYGPPIITYFVPPAIYTDLYVWLPFRFWWRGWSFGGCWMMADFHKPYFYRGHQGYVTNHYVDRDGRVIIIDPGARHRGEWRRPDMLPRAPRSSQGGGSIEHKNIVRPPVFHGGGGHRR